MSTAFTSPFPQTPIYKKAGDIFTLSINISQYLSEDLAPLKENGEEDFNIYFTGDIVQQSNSLAPFIYKAESQVFAEDKYKYVALITKLTNLLHKNCERLEHINSNGKDFLPMLRKELKKFRKLQQSWMLTL